MFPSEVKAEIRTTRREEDAMHCLLLGFGNEMEEFPRVVCLELSLIDRFCLIGIGMVLSSE